MSSFSEIIKSKRLAFGMSQREFANLLGIKGNGEATVRGWENQEDKPSASKQRQINALNTEIPFRKKKSSLFDLKAIDLFAGIGGMRLAFQNFDVNCVFSSEWDKYSQKTYAANFGELPFGDITKINAKNIPDHDILMAGFPCQAFSKAGLRKGFDDTRGTLFFDIQRILVEKEPRMFLLENVKQLAGHDQGRTLKTIMAALTGRQAKLSEDIVISDEARDALSAKLNYWVDYRVLSSADFGVPQKRERIYLVGFNKNYYGDGPFENYFSWPEPFGLPTSVRQILQPPDQVDKKYTISQKLLEGHERRKREHLKKGNGFGFSVFKPEDSYTNTLSARYYKDGSEILIDQSNLGLRPRKLTPRECARLQGYPEEFIIDAASDVEIYRQFGNSVSVPVVRAVAFQMMCFDRLASSTSGIKS